MEESLQRHSVVFEEGLGAYTGLNVNIRVKPNRFQSFARFGHYHLRRERPWNLSLSGWRRKGSLSWFSNQKRASPVVTVTKADGSIRLCGDYKRTLNPACVIDQYALPQVDDIFARFSSCQQFTQINLTQAYLLTLEEGCRRYTMINTTHGLFQFRHIPFGMASASAIF